MSDTPSSRIKEFEEYLARLEEYADNIADALIALLMDKQEKHSGMVRALKEYLCGETNSFPLSLGKNREQLVRDSP